MPDKPLIHEQVVKVLVIDAHGQGLILYRSGTHPRFAHQPDLPGGTVEPSEDFVTALQREILEEISIPTQPDQFKKLFAKVRSTDYPERVTKPLTFYMR
jgi:8-oxo-dGTP pyrophosphatase MutT (NUDIX family)